MLQHIAWEKVQNQHYDSVKKEVFFFNVGVKQNLCFQFYILSEVRRNFSEFCQALILMLENW